MKKFQRVRTYVPFLLLLVAFAFVAQGVVSNRATSPVAGAIDERSSSALIVSMPPAPTSSERTLAGMSKITEAESSESSVPVSKEIELDEKFLCSGSLAIDFRCYENYYKHIILSKGVEKGVSASFQDLKARAANNSYALGQCHPLTHSLGRFAAESSTDVASAYMHGDSYCWSGYYHGVLETFVYRIGAQDLNQKINGICESLNNDKRYSFNYFNCVHGLGHGLMAITDDDIPASLTYCDALKGDWEQQSCAGGVYMENVIADGLNHATNWLDPNRPHFPCDVSSEQYKNTCYLMQTSYMLKINGGDFTKTFALCRDAGPFQNTCHQSLGRDASGRHSSNVQRTHDICLLGANETEVTHCVIGAVKDFISYFHSDEQGKLLCETFDEPVRQTCLDTARAYYVGY